ncbi:MAG: histidine triad nucleotide-binding protein [Betaproteobacteria bacterium]|jgi:Diadenosine tetraphosphate (Ap4A) hydrolase and other HIT family hydrolases|nr:histidine triad nucleotide-binding protein [Betaproteobacteria bacterium]
MSHCLFCRIVRGELPAKKVYEDEEVLAFHDIHPAAPVHFMLIPKVHRDSLAHCFPEDAALLGKMLMLATQLAKEQGLVDGFRTVINTGTGGGQEIYHLHIHVMGGLKSSALTRSDDK